MGRAAAIAAALLVLGAGYGAFITRHTVLPVGAGGLYIFDRWTGRLEFCTPTTCQPVPHGLEDAPFAR